jgi:hypothetical protein
MKIHIWSNGDSSVGFLGCSATVEIDEFENWFYDQPEVEDNARKFIKTELTKVFSEIFDDGSTNVVFEDEIEDVY